jgi:hypothetical protein
MAPDKLLFRLFLLAMLTQRVAFHAGDMQVPLALFIYGATALILFMRGQLAIKHTLLLAALGSLSLLIIACLASGKPFSMPSVMYLFVLYLPFAFGPANSSSAVTPSVAGLKWFSTMMFVFALVAIWQYGSQVYLHIPYSDPFELLPEALRIKGYIISYPLVYGSPIYKSNAYLFLEPSFLSQFLALALIIEICTSRRLLIMGVQVAGIATTFSGTGLLLIAAALPFAILANLNNLRVAATAGVCALAIVGAVVTNPSVLNRAGEMQDPGSSGSVRFSTPYEFLTDLSVRSPSNLLVGYGAGAVDRLTHGDQSANFPAIPKAIIEYGLLGGLPLLVLIAVRIFRSVPEFPVAFGLFCMQFFLSGALLQPISIFLLFYFFALKPYKPFDAFGSMPLYATGMRR